MIKGGWVMVVLVHMGMNGSATLTGMRPRFLSQKIEQKDPEKKMPSTAAKAIRRSENAAQFLSVHLRAH